MQRRLFGAFVVAEGYVTEGQLGLALEHQSRLRQTRLGDILVAQGSIPRALLERAALDQMDIAGGGRLRIGEFLVGEGLVRQAGWPSRSAIAASGSARCSSSSAS